MSEIFIHIGLHRTGTTFLQKNVFPKIRDIEYYGRFKNEFFSVLNNYALSVNTRVNRKILISDEGLSTTPFINCNETTVFTYADRLKKIFPTAKIIVTFREKKEWKKSLYNYYLLSFNNTLSYKEWEKNIFNKKDYDHKEFREYLKKLFDNVLILHYKDLKRNPHDFIGDICKFMDVKKPDIKMKIENPSPSPRAIRAIEWMKKKEWIPDSIITKFGFLFRIIANQSKK